MLTEIEDKSAELKNILLSLFKHYGKITLINVNQRLLEKTTPTYMGSTYQVVQLSTFNILKMQYTPSIS